VSGAWTRWVAMWSEREHPRSLALVRILLGACILFDFLEIARLDLVTALFAPVSAGGLSDALSRANVPLYYQWMPAEVWSGRLLHAACTVLAATFTLGW
jgi:hypothetical protein